MEEVGKKPLLPLSSPVRAVSRKFSDICGQISELFIFEMSDALLSSINLNSISSSSGPALYSFDLPDINPSGTTNFNYNQSVSWDKPGTFALFYASTVSGTPYGSSAYSVNTPIIQFWPLSCSSFQVMCGCHSENRYTSIEYVRFMPLTAISTPTSISLSGTLTYNSSRGWYLSTDIIGNSTGHKPLSITGIKLMIF